MYMAPGYDFHVPRKRPEIGVSGQVRFHQRAALASYMRRLTRISKELLYAITGEYYLPGIFALPWE
jgi:hypothetical protein